MIATMFLAIFFLMSMKEEGCWVTWKDNQSDLFGHFKQHVCHAVSFLSSIVVFKEFLLDTRVTLKGFLVGEIVPSTAVNWECFDKLVKRPNLLADLRTIREKNGIVDMWDQTRSGATGSSSLISANNRGNEADKVDQSFSGVANVVACSAIFLQTLLQFLSFWQISTLRLSIILVGLLLWWTAAMVCTKFATITIVLLHLVAQSPGARVVLASCVLLFL
jgi:hypothetical protein